MFKKTIFQNTVNKHRTQDTEHRHRTQNTNTANFRSSTSVIQSCQVIVNTRRAVCSSKLTHREPEGLECVNCNEHKGSNVLTILNHDNCVLTGNNMLVKTIETTQVVV